MSTYVALVTFRHTRSLSAEIHPGVLRDCFAPRGGFGSYRSRTIQLTACVRRWRARASETRLSRCVRPSVGAALKRFGGVSGLCMPAASVEIAAPFSVRVARPRLDGHRSPSSRDCGK